MTDMSDEAVMEKVQKGETALLGLLAQRYEKALYAFAARP